MKKTIIFAFFFLCFNVKAQDSQIKTVYYLGGGPAVEGNLGMWAIHFTNQFSYCLNNRISINPTLTYFSSLEDIENPVGTRKNSDRIMLQAFLQMSRYRLMF